MRWLPIAARLYVVEIVVIFLLGQIWLGPGTSLAGAAVFSLLMTGLLVGMTAFRTRGRPDLALVNRQRASFVLPLDAADLHARALAVLQALPATTRTDTALRIDARTGIGWSSWGENVTVEFVPMGGATAVDVEAGPLLRWAVISDYARTRGLVDHVAAGLAGPVSSTPSPDPALS